jgi:hypothetical protein
MRLGNSRGLSPTIDMRLHRTNAAQSLRNSIVAMVC